MDLKVTPNVAWAWSAWGDSELGASGSVGKCPESWKVTALRRGMAGAGDPWKAGPAEEELERFESCNGE